MFQKGRQWHRRNRRTPSQPSNVLKPRGYGSPPGETSSRNSPEPVLRFCSSDGKLLTSSGSDTTVILWDLDALRP